MALIANRRSLPVWMSITAAPVLLLGSSLPASACSCFPPESPAEREFMADAVFVGTVQSVIEDDPHATKDLGMFEGLRFQVDVSQVWKGSVNDYEEMTTGRYGGICGYYVEPGVEYLFYASRRHDTSHYAIWECSGTMRYADAAIDLEYLASAKSYRKIEGIIAALAATFVAVLIYHQRRRHQSAA